MSQRYFSPISSETLKLPFYITSIGLNISQKNIERKDGHIDYQWLQCTEGEGIFLYKNKEYIIRPNQGIFIYNFDPHQYYPLKSNWKDFWISFNGTQIENVLEALGFKSTEVYNISNPTHLLKKIEQCYTTCTLNTPLHIIEASSYLYGFLFDLAKYTIPFDKESYYQQYCRISPVIKYIAQNYHQPISLENLAKLLDITPQHFCVLFKDIYKMRPFEYINYVRITKSKELLVKNKKLSIATIANKVGYDSPSYFCIQFKKIEKISPSNFREIN